MFGGEPAHFWLLFGQSCLARNQVELKGAKLMEQAAVDGCLSLRFPKMFFPPNPWCLIQKWPKILDGTPNRPSH